MSLNLQKLVSSQPTYDRSIKQTIDIINKDKDSEAVLKKVILFCKYAFSVGGNQRKKFLCLCLIKDISNHFKSELFEKVLDEHVPIKLLKMINSETGKKIKESRTIDDESEYTEKLVNLAVETISFWTKKLSHTTQKSMFSNAYEELKKLKINIPKSLNYYKSENFLIGLWGEKEDLKDQLGNSEEISPLIVSLHQEFSACKSILEEKTNQALLNDTEIYLKAIIDKLRTFLLHFFTQYKALDQEPTVERDILVVYFHIINSIFKKISNKFYISAQELISITKISFEENHKSELESVDRMDIVNLAGVQKYNVLTIFERIHHRIEEEEQKMTPFQMSFTEEQSKSKKRETDRRPSNNSKYK